jgi:hypothetical protein
MKTEQLRQVSMVILLHSSQPPSQGSTSGGISFGGGEISRIGVDCRLIFQESPANAGLTTV